MQDLLSTLNRYTQKLSQTQHGRPSAQFAARQFVGSLLNGGKTNSLCAASIVEFMCSPESVVVVSKDGIQAVFTGGNALTTSAYMTVPSMGELSAVAATESRLLVGGSGGILCADKTLHGIGELQFTDAATSILCLSTTPDGQFFASGGSNASVTVWTSDMHPLHYLAGHTDWVHFVRFANWCDELQLFSTGDDGIICQWDPIEGVALSRLDYSKGQNIQVFEVSFWTGLLAVTCNSPVLALYRCRSNRYTRQLNDDVLRLQQVGLLTGIHTSVPTFARFSEDAMWIATAAEDETLAISSVAEPRQTFVCHELVTRRHCLTFMNTINAITFLASPPFSSAIIVVASASDGTVLLWVVDPRDDRMHYTKRIQLHVGSLLSMSASSA